MFEREMMISGLQKQQQLLENLIREIESKPAFRVPDLDFMQERTKKVANNLRRLRKIKSDYFTYQNIYS
jgi:hypothetical protein